MTDRLDIPVETSGGWQPRPSAGERIVVALAAVALMGAVLIIGGNLLKRDDAASVASGSPRPTSVPSPTPQPTPSPREISLLQVGPASGEPVPSLFGGWIRASVDLPILADPIEGATLVGTLPAGGLAYADEQSQGSRELGWVTIEGPDATGWAATRAGGRDLVKRYLPPDAPASGGLWSIAAGPGGFVAIGNAAGRTIDYAPPAEYFSRDGASWRAASEPPLARASPVSVTWGPAGWLLVTDDQGSSTTRIWGSPDGERWRSLGVLDAGYPKAVHASSLGYLLQTWGPRAGAPQEAWFSTDGIRWTESNPGLGGDVQVTATTAGYYASSIPGCCRPGTQADGAAFSADGLAWSATRPNLLVVGVGDLLLGIERGPDGRGGQPVRGSFNRGRLGWRTVKDGNVPFTGAVVTSLVSDGRQATAFGWDATTEAALTWTSEGGPWARHLLPPTFGGIPSQAASGGAGIVVVGNRTNSRGPNPVIWRRSGSGAWQPEPSPVLGFAPDPSAGDCGPPPADAVEFVNMDRTLAVACRGDAPLTVRLYSNKCDGCAGEAQGTYDQAWLASPTSGQLYLSPVKWPDNWFSSAVLAPALGSAPDPSWVGAWLELTGHLDDPAARGCRWTPPPDQLRSYRGVLSIIGACRQQFVVTAVRVIDGP